MPERKPKDSMENFSNDFKTTLTSGLTAAATTANVAASAGSPDANFRIRVDDEYMLVTNKGAGTQLVWTITRGIEGTTAVDHFAGAEVTHVLTAGGVLQHLQDRLPSQLVNSDIKSGILTTPGTMSPAQLKTAVQTHQRHTALSTSRQPYIKGNWTKKQLFTAAQMGTSSIYWIWPFETTDRLVGASHRWYIYFSTDHDATLGGIYLVKTDDLTSDPATWGPATLVWRDNATWWSSGAGQKQTETPSVLWDPVNSRMCMYYQQCGAKYGAGDSVNAKGSQSTLMAYSTNGTSWTKDPNFIIDIPFLTSQLGDGHTGYFLPFQTKRGLFAYCLYGGTTAYQDILLKNIGNLGGQLDGTVYRNDWISDRIHLGYCNDLLYGYESAVFGVVGNFRAPQWNHSFVSELSDVEYWIGPVTNGAAGGGSRIGRIAITPIASDYRHWLERPKTIWEPTEAWESNDLRCATPVMDGNTLRVLYTLESTKAGMISYDL